MPVLVLRPPHVLVIRVMGLVIVVIVVVVIIVLIVVLIVVLPIVTVVFALAMPMLPEHVTYVSSSLGSRLSELDQHIQQLFFGEWLQHFSERFPSRERLWCRPSYVFFILAAQAELHRTR
jgi:ABC-type transport system involved in cytochrome bd biosynthesis fused ATPase/permease subunit